MAVTEGTTPMYGMINGGMFKQQFAGDGTPIDAAPVQVGSADGAGTWLAGAGLDQGGNLYIGWYFGDIWYGGGGNLYAQQFRPDGTTWTDQLQITPQSVGPGNTAAWAASSISVAPDGSLLAGWTTYDLNDGNLAVQARRYDTIVDSTTETDTLTPASGSGNVAVTSTATTFADHVLWEYRVTNNSSSDLGQFTISGQPENVTDETNSLNWGASSTGIGWAAGGYWAPLAPGQEAYFTFTTPSAYAVQPTAATAGGGAFTTTVSGNILGPGLTGPETDTLTAGTLGGQIAVTSTVTPDGQGDLIWDYQVTNNSSTGIGEFAFLDAPLASIPSFTSSLGWAVNENDTGWAAGPNDPLLAPGETADFEFTTTPVAADHIAVRATSSDGTNAAEGTVLGPSDPATATQTTTATLTDGGGNNVSVTATATTFSSYILWQYTVTNNNNQSLGNFTVPGFTGPLTDVSDASSSTGWTPDSADLGWTAGSSGQQLASGQTATFSFTTPSAYTVGPTTATATSSDGSTTTSGSTLGPSPTMTETTLLTMADGFDPPQYVQVTSSATIFPDHILWQYQVTNLNFTAPDPDIGGFRAFDVPIIPGADPVSAVTVPAGWLWTESGGDWEADTETPVPPGGSAYFSFNTAVTAIGQVWAAAAFKPFARDAGGDVFGTVEHVISATLDQNIPVNANNDNGKNLPNGAGWVKAVVPGTNGQTIQTGIPKVRDYDAKKLTAPDPDLKPLVIRSTAAVAGRITVSAVVAPGAAGRVQFWADQNKNNPYAGGPIAANGTVTVYVEGFRPSEAQNDLTVKVEFAGNDGSSDSWTQDESVSPFVSLIQMTPQQGAMFLNGTDGRGGAKVQVPNAGQIVPGMSYQLNIYRAGASGNTGFIQYVTGVTNGGAALGGAQHGFVMTAGTNPPNLDLKLNPNVPGAAWDLIDNPNFVAPFQPQNFSPFYPAMQLFDPPGNNIPAGLQVAIGQDSPGYSAPATGGDKLTSVALGWYFKVYVMWKFDDGSIYTLGTFVWSAKLIADTYVAGAGVTRIAPGSGTTGNNNSFKFDHSNPPKLVPPTVQQGLAVLP